MKMVQSEQSIQNILYHRVYHNVINNGQKTSDHSVENYIELDENI